MEILERKDDAHTDKYRSRMDGHNTGMGICTRHVLGLPSYGVGRCIMLDILLVLSLLWFGFLIIGLADLAYRL